MNDQRNLTIGVDFGLKDSINQLESIYGSIQGIKAGFQGAEDSGVQMGSRVARSAGTMADGLHDADRESRKVITTLDRLEDSGDGAGSAIRDAGVAFDRFGDKAEENVGLAKDELRDAAKAADAFGSEIAKNSGTAAKDMDGVSDAARDAGDAFEDAGVQVERSYVQMGAEADSFKKAVIITSATANKETNSISKTIKAGLQGAYGYAGKKAAKFTRDAVNGARDVKEAFTHPIQTIRSKLSDALERAREHIDDVGDEADKTGADLDKMGSDGSGAGTAIKDAMGSAVKSFFAVSAAIEVFKKGVELAKQFGSAVLEVGKSAEQTGAKFEAAFSPDSGVKEWSENFSSAIHRSNTEVQSFLVSNKAMYNELGITGEAATELSKITTSLAYDLGTAFKMDDSEALSVMQDYINGNTKALSEYGIQIDDAVLKQSAMEMGLGKNIDNLDDYAMAQVRMNALLKNSTQIQQMAAKEQEGYANGIKSLNGIWQNFLADAAERFAPVFTDLTNTLLTSWPQIEPVLMGIVDTMSIGISSGAPAIMSLAKDAIPPLIDVIGQLGSIAGPVGGTLLNIATTALPPLSRIIGTMATTIVPPFVNILKVLGDDVVVPLMPYVESIANSILPALSAGLKMIPPILQTISPVLGGIVDILSRVVSFLSKIVQWAAGGLAGLLDKVAGVFGGGSSAAKSAGAKIPHNADGDPDFKGGWTHINERGGEIAYLPSGSAIIPADKSEQIINNSRQSSVKTDINFNPTIKVEIHGDSEGGGTKLTDDLKQMIKELYQEMQEEHYDQMAIQQGNA